MGHLGMHYSLASRELIADMVESVAMAHAFDGLVLLTNCDKITPGMLMAAARIDIPTIVVTAGPMHSGSYRGNRVNLITAFEAVGKVRKGEMSAVDLAELGPAPARDGSWGMYAANTMACVTESLGMSLPGYAASSCLRRSAGSHSRQQADRGTGNGESHAAEDRDRTPSNAIRIDMASGFDKYHAHIPAALRQASASPSG
jgi:dihydroxy-acid dehydratase